MGKDEDRDTFISTLKDIHQLKMAAEDKDKKGQRKNRYDHPFSLISSVLGKGGCRLTLTANIALRLI